MNTSNTTHTWHFFRSGGLDQALLRTGADLANLKTLDQKLWTALSCPTTGIRFDAATLKLLDTDADGRIHASEILHAIDGSKTRLLPRSVARWRRRRQLAGSIPEPRKEGPAMPHVFSKNSRKRRATPSTLAECGIAAIFAETRFKWQV